MQYKIMQPEQSTSTVAEMRKDFDQIKGNSFLFDGKFSNDFWVCSDFKNITNGPKLEFSFKTICSLEQISISNFKYYSWA